jgi:hypothetical protein
MFDASTTITSMSVFLRMLSTEQDDPEVPKQQSLSKDLIILDPTVRLEPAMFDELLAGLIVFRSEHPHAAIITGKPADVYAQFHMEMLRDKGLVDDVGKQLADEFGNNVYETFTQVLYRGAVILERKLADAVADGKAIPHCSPDDPGENVFVEHIAVK